MNNFRETPLVLAHRGGRAEYDDNSVGAFADALAHGVRGAETDVRLTKDGHLIIMHDATVDRTTNGHGPIAEMTLAEATALRLKRCGENVPTFRQFCEVYRGRDDVDIEIEMKLHGDEMEPALLDRYVTLLHDEAAELLVAGTYAFTSFSIPTLKRFRELFPEVKLGYICGELTEQTIEEALSVGCMRIAPDWNQATGPIAVKRAHDAGLSVNLWCSNSRDIYDIVKLWGADVSTSDIPRFMRDYAVSTQSR